MELFQYLRYINWVVNLISLVDHPVSDIADSRKSANQNNLPNARKSIPDFFYQPKFLQINNSFDFNASDGSGTFDSSLLAFLL